MSKVRPIIFSAPMVRAILDGRKTQTRRIVKPQPMLADKVVYNNGEVGEWRYMHEGRRWRNEEIYEGDPFRCPYGGVGGVLWVREAFRADPMCDDNLSPEDEVYYEADRWFTAMGGKLRSPMLMPRWASRIDLEITGVRIERLQEISESDAQAEGVLFHGFEPDEDMDRFGGAANCLAHRLRYAYRQLWESIHGHGSWESNPFVWVITFKRVK